MKRKLLSLLLITCCLAGASACSLPFGEKESASQASSTDASSVASLEESASASIEETKKTEVEKTTADMVVIRVRKTEGGETLMSVMEELQADGAMNFTVQSGMVTSINGKANPADFSSCWMLYTSDTEMSNTAWGEIDYNGGKLGSAVLGADALPVAEGEIYVWYYQSF